MIGSKMGLIQKSKFCRPKTIDYQHIIFLLVAEEKLRPDILKNFMLCRVIFCPDPAPIFRNSSLLIGSSMEITETLPAVQTLAGRTKLFEDLYREAFPKVAAFVSSRSGSFQDAKDIFQDSLVIFYEKVTHEQFEIHLSEAAYVTGIAKHLWLRKFKREAGHVSLEDAECAITIPEDYNPAFETGKLMSFLERTGKKCMELLKAFYYDRQSMEEITHGFGYRTSHSATVQKFKCLEKMRETVKEKSIRYEDFTE
jgi:DNA-directed RNA polymerase specialized sigma24 family protein